MCSYLQSKETLLLKSRRINKDLDPFNQFDLRHLDQYSNKGHYLSKDFYE